MGTDSKFRTFMRAHLDEQLYNRLMNKYTHYRITFLTKVSTEVHPEYILILVEEFLASLSFAEASEYVNRETESIGALIFCCVDINLIKRIIKYVADVDARDARGSTALMCACYRLNLNVIQFYLDRGADAKAKNFKNTTALMCTCASEHKSESNMDENFEQIIELLIFSDADPHIVSKDGQTAYNYVKDKSLLSLRSQQLLQGHIKMNNTKRAH